VWGASAKEISQIWKTISRKRFRYKFFFAIRKIPERQFSKKGEKFCKTQGKKCLFKVHETLDKNELEEEQTEVKKSNKTRKCRRKAGGYFF
jgi:hypothetical protein